MAETENAADLVEGIQQGLRGKGAKKGAKKGDKKEAKKGDETGDKKENKQEARHHDGEGGQSSGGQSSVARLFSSTFNGNGTDDTPLDPTQHLLALGVAAGAENITNTSDTGGPTNSSTRGGLQRCEVCPAGKYSSLADFLVPKTSSRKGGENDLGWELSMGTTSCTACPPGKMQPKPRSSGCIACPAGQYAADPATPLCLNCPAGYQQINDGLKSGGESCGACVAGRFSTGRLVHHQGQENRLRRRVLSASKESLSSNSSDGGGHLPPVDEIKEEAKEGRAPEDESDDAPGLRQQVLRCTRCPVGTYVARPAQERCRRCWCIPGTHRTVADSDTQRLLGPGTWVRQIPSENEAGHRRRRLARGGTSAASVTSEAHLDALAAGCACAPCVAGRYSNGGQSEKECKWCPEGQQQPALRSTSCRRCEPGRFAVLNRSKCVYECPEGTNADRNKSACVGCPHGKVAYHKASPFRAAKTVQCVFFCPSGSYKFNPTDGPADMGVCRSCPEGKHQVRSREDSR
jgi:hypothetical protein